MSNIIVTINLVVLNGEKYIRYCLDAVLAQTYPRELIEINILDNGSNDNTKEIIRNLEIKKFRNLEFAKFFLMESKKNLGVWPGQEELLKHSNGKYVICLCVDVLMDKDFVKNVAEAMEKDKKVGALQPKIYKFGIESLPAYRSRWQSHRGSSTESGLTGLPAKIIDTCGFQIFRSRRVTNICHGEEDKGQYDNLEEIFAVEGAVPVFRREALENCRIKLTTSDGQRTSDVSSAEIVDHDFFWYGDDLDLAWRMRLFGWKEVFAPNIIAWHDRQTTKTLKKSWLDYFSRIPIRRQIPIKKRRLDWRNTRWTLVKNDYIINILKDLPWIILREIAVLGYAVLFEPEILKEVPVFFKYLPKMLRKRKEIMKLATASPADIRKWMK